MSVYFIRSGNFIKIGKANNPWKRLADFQTASVDELKMLAIMPGDLDIEAEIHNRFRHLSNRGEWFSVSSELLVFIEAVKHKYPEAQKRQSLIQRSFGRSTIKGGEDNWRFEIKRKPRIATRKNRGTTVHDDWYYWVVRVNDSKKQTVYYGSLDVLTG